MKRLVAELGLRFRPHREADLEAHAAAVALLVNDLADIPEKPLRAAIGDWVVRKPFMPKAAEIIASAQRYIAGTMRFASMEEKARAMLPAMNDTLSRRDCVWDVDSAGAFVLRDL